MFIGYNVRNTIHRNTSKDSYNILYRPDNSCIDHFINTMLDKLGHQTFIDSPSISDSLCLDGWGPPINYTISYNTNAPNTPLGHQSPNMLILYSSAPIDTNALSHILNNNVIITFSQKIYNTLQSKTDRIFHIPINVHQILNGFYTNNIESKNIDIGILQGSMNDETIKAIKTNILQHDKNLTINICKDYSDNSLKHFFANIKCLLQIEPNKPLNYLYAQYSGTLTFTTQNLEIDKDIHLISEFTEFVDKYKNIMENTYSKFVKSYSIEKNKWLINTYDTLSVFNEISDKLNRSTITYYA